MQVLERTKVWHLYMLDSLKLLLCTARFLFLETFSGPRLGTQELYFHVDQRNRVEPLVPALQTVPGPRTVLP